MEEQIKKINAIITDESIRQLFIDSVNEAAKLICQEKEHNIKIEKQEDIIINGTVNDELKQELRNQIFKDNIKTLVCKDCKKDDTQTLFKRQKKRCHECYTKIKADYYKTDWKKKYYKYEQTGAKRGRPKKNKDNIENLNNIKIIDNIEI